MAEEGKYEYYVGIVMDEILTDSGRWTSFSDTLDLSELLAVNSDPVVSIRALRDNGTVTAEYVSITPGAVLGLPEYGSDSGFSDSQILITVTASSLADENDKMSQEGSGFFLVWRLIK